MSLSLLRSTVADLPYLLREQVLGYAESVNQALPGIFREAHVKQTAELSSQVVYLAGVRKLHGLVASSYWALDNSASPLQASDVYTTRMGAQDFSRHGQIHSALKNVLEALERALSSVGARDIIELPYAELIQNLAKDGSQ